MTARSNGKTPPGGTNYIAEAAGVDAPMPILNSVTLDTVTPQRVDWLWPGRLPYGKLWLLDGDPGLGKSFITLELAACITTGRALPGAAPTAPADVVIVNLEDGLADTIRVRAEAAGADLTRLHCITSVTDSTGEERPPRLPDDVPLIKALVQRTGARLVVIDPLTAYLDGKLDTHKDADMRRALLPLGAMADALGVAVLVVRHLTKRRGGVAILAGGGSIGIIGAARGGLMLFEDPDDPTRRLLAVAKNNLAAKPPAIRCVIQDDGGGPRVHWDGDTTHTADSLLTAALEHDEQRGALAEAAEWLREYLREGEKPKPDIVKDAHRTGIATRTLERAKDELHIAHARRGFGRGSTVVWILPEGPYSPTPPMHAEVGEYGTSRGPKSLCDNAPTYSPTEGASDGEYGDAPPMESTTSPHLAVLGDGDVVVDANGNQTLTAAARHRLRAIRNGAPAA